MAVGAATQHGEVMGVDGEAKLSLGSFGQASEECARGFDHLPALLADEVPMCRCREVKGRRTMPEMGMHDHTKAFELVQVPIDRRKVNVGCLSMHLGGELFGRTVALGVEKRS